MTATVSTIDTQLHGQIRWDYREEKTRVYSLYELAKSKVWKTSEAPWEALVDHSLPPSRHQFEPLAGFAPFDALPSSRRIDCSWYRHGLEISDILHGEQGALLVSSQLVSCMPDIEAKLFASSQVSDEARHVEFFSRYLLEVVGDVHPPSDAVAALIKAMVNDPRWDYKFIACQILIESLALARLQDIRRATLVPVLAHAIDFISADEARHVKFGTEILRRHLASLNASELQTRSDFVVDHLLGLADAMNIYTRIANEFDWDVRALRFHLRQNRIRQPQPRHDLFRQLMLNMNSVGLLTPQTERRLSGLA
ncbi:ferritin-like domain-containing protein [Pseudohongiella sp.]|uniref:Ferritin-like domain-containing protein n=1 Tax=marine sediment metagenome TaxID=412755 RepID=A0A0F9W316_9ZZZZ|nr:ferritin-like domain-containing protein [Pseudohongiella sp.]HDZ09970.1 ferritin-like domain-containing protein [Pseudohongiella sp.]HEA64395.1 ferritin-like domain-containing protein [Pseudohongiella sp.]